MAKFSAKVMVVWRD